MRLLRRLAPAAAAALSGVLLYVSFPPRTLWWLALPAFAVLAGCLHGRTWKAGLGLGYLFGLGFLLPLLVWTGVEVGPGPWLALAAVEAVFVALVGAGTAVLSRLPGYPLWAAALWIAGEAARARVPFSGFPWGKIAFGQADGFFLRARRARRHSRARLRGRPVRLRAVRDRPAGPYGGRCARGAARRRGGRPAQRPRPRRGRLRRPSAGQQ
ncbi:Apolipoprotein N-acyltransferase [Streptomyces alboniger]